MHARRSILEAVATVLNTSPTKWSRAYITRAQVQREVQTYITVFSASESADAQIVHPTNLYLRDMTLITRGYCRVADTQIVETTMDAVAESLETKLTRAAIAATLTKVKSLVLISTDSEIDEDERPLGVITLTWLIRYATTEGAPGTMI